VLAALPLLANSVSAGLYDSHILIGGLLLWPFQFVFRVRTIGLLKNWFRGLVVVGHA
jgi:hypothetical protein